ncbi:MAG: efflux RND transporter periplasmic adaptor subunit [Candidatus Obscuribacter sp.]|nr:efflux RND transporter periplasmic adaptor subunit [Candidatus Obscuribacter sp.]MBK9617662.1 efflux RND transporter periplasmic adaptor subunit [Candidatus Obscuribacter sp.]
MKLNRTTRPAQSRSSRGMGKLIIVIIIVVAVAAILLTVGFLPRMARTKELDKMHTETAGAVPLVRTIIAKPAVETESLTLPGNIGAIQYTTIYARVDGYLRDRMVDIGDHVKTGQLLARIDTPTIDESLAQAKADLVRAQANVDKANADYKEAVAKQATAQAEIEKATGNVAYATVTATRWQNLVSRGAVSAQSRDEKVRLLEATSADLKANNSNLKAAEAQVLACKSQIAEAKANVVAKQAEVARITAEQNFQKVVAPFDGIITLRKVDPGALITKGSQSDSLELFQLAKIDRLRIYVNAPQRVARYLKKGMVAQVMVPEYPDGNYKGVVTNISGGLDPNTRTRQTEIQIDNKDHALLPGMYAEVNLTGSREEKWITVPGTTIVTRPEGQYLLIAKDGKAHYQQVTIGRDFGSEVEIRTGLSGNEHVAVSPNDDIIQGEAVKEEPIVQ